MPNVGIERPRRAHHLIVLPDTRQNDPISNKPVSLISAGFDLYDNPFGKE